MSRLRDALDETKPSRYEYSNGSRKLYDRGKAPDGVDYDIWHLALYFEQAAESYGRSVPGLPICYTELSHRIHTCGITHTDGNWVEVVESMISLYWSREGTNDYAINDFTGIEKWNYYYKVVTDTNKRTELIRTGTRVLQSDHVRTKEPKGTSNIITKEYSEEELATKIQQFKDRNEHRS